ncbi:MAG TPA: M3 family metallopeptidase, partial [Polyangia bacterium]
MNRIQLITFAALALTAGGCAHSKSAPHSAATPASSKPVASVVHVPFSQLAAVDVPELRWKYTPEEIATECAQAETTATGELAKLVAQPDAQRTFASSFDAFEQIMTDYTDRVTRLSFLKEVHPDAKVRAAAANCEERSGKFFVEVGARKDLYLAMKGYQANQEKTEPLAPIDRRLIEITMRDFRRNGLALSDADRAKLVEIRSQIAKLQTEYSANLDNDTSSIEATAAELAGLPASYLARLKKAPDGKYIVTTKYPDYYPLMENARAEELRKREYLAFNSRQTEKNLPLLTQAVALRADAAKLLGYANHADFVTETRMAKNSAEVIAFLKKLGTELEPGAAALDKRMLALKRKETHDRHAV